MCAYMPRRAPYASTLRVAVRCSTAFGSMQGRSCFDRFDFDMDRYVGFDIASIFGPQNPCRTELFVT